MLLICTKIDSQNEGKGLAVYHKFLCTCKVHRNENKYCFQQKKLGKFFYIFNTRPETFKDGCLGIITT